MSVKTIPLAELNQLKKIMGMTGSSHDAEAVAAVRKANAILAKHGLTWPDFFDRTVSAAAVHETLNQGPFYDKQEGPRRSHQPDFGNTSTEPNVKDMIQNAFDELRGTKMNEGFKTFLNSIEDQFRKSGYLTPAQRRPLMEAVMRHRQRTGREA